MTRLPAVTVGRLQRIPRRRVGAGAAALALVLLAAAARGDPAPPLQPRSVASALLPGTVAVRVPHSWLAAEPVRLARDDRLDLLGARPGERVVAVASDARVLEPGVDSVVLELVLDDAVALAASRASGHALFTLLRPAQR